MTVRIRLPGGTLKIKGYRDLRTSEREALVPVWRIGSTYFIWWSNKKPQQPTTTSRR